MVERDVPSMPETRNRVHEDDDVNKLLTNRRIKKVFDQNQSLSNNFVRAAQILAREDDAVQHMLTAMTAICENKIKVFFSYKEEDAASAQSIMRILNEVTDGKLSISSMSDIGSGTNYKDVIVDMVNDCHWFVLLLPSVPGNLGWCLFEVGYFDPIKKNTKLYKLISLRHNETPIPDPISDFSTNTYDVNSVTDLLKQICFKKDFFPGFDFLKQNASNRRRIKDEAKKLADAISPPLKDVAPTLLCCFARILLENLDEITLFEDLSQEKLEEFSAEYETVRNAANDSARRESIEEIMLLRNIEALSKATVIETNSPADAMLGLVQQPQNWADILACIATDTTSRQWLSQLCKGIAQSVKGHMPSPVQSSFKVQQSGKMYRPILLESAKANSNGGYIFTILFVEDTAAVDPTRIPREVYVVTQALRFAYRFRWEIIEPFIAREIAPDDLVSLRGALEQMELEAQNLGLDDPAFLSGLFSVTDASKIEEQYDRWAELRKSDLTGELDIAFKKMNAKGVQKVLEELIPSNNDLIEILSRRFTEDHVPKKSDS